MKFAFFPGCVSRGACPELYTSTVKISEILGIELDEKALESASCTGAGVLQEKNQLLGDTLNARNIALAEKQNLPILTICSTCQGVMSQAEYRLENEEYRAQINETLAEEDLEYTGKTPTRHILWIIVEEIGEKKFKSLVKRQLEGLRLAPFYGCYLVRPSKALKFYEKPERETCLEDLTEWVGATVVDFPGKTACCGFPIVTINEKASLKMVGNHTSTAKDLGASAMVTPCPLCHLNLDQYQDRAAWMMEREIDLPIIHVPQLVGLALGLDPEELKINKHVISTKKLLTEISLKP
tara:strand:- start:43 stop:930 length:888 start_codon:yes stop_codon:yes gene_type:complete